MDGRQKALKLMANAMYGFTGAQPSPVRLVALADACLSLGAAVCHRARQTLEDPNSAAALGRHLGIGKHVNAPIRPIWAPCTLHAAHPRCVCLLAV